MDKVTILVVEDEGIVAKDIQNRLKKLGYRAPAVAMSGKKALEKARRLQPDLILMDIMLRGEMDGIEAAGLIKEELNIPVIYLTAYSDDQTLKRAKETEPYNYILKPFDNSDLRIGIELALHKHRSEFKLKQREKWLTTVLKSLGDAVIATDERGVINFVNDCAVDLLGVSQDDLYGRPLEKHLLRTNGVSEPVSRILQKVLSGRVTVDLEKNYYFLGAGEQRMPIEGSCTPVRYSKEVVVGMVVIFRRLASRGAETGRIPKQGNGVHEILQVPSSGIREGDILGMLAIAPMAREVSRNWVQTFSGFDVTLDGNRLDIGSWRSKKAADLLAFLVLHYPHPVHKEVAMEFLWPGTGPNISNRRLHHVVSELRRYTTPGSSGYERDRFIVYQQDAYSLNQEEGIIIDHIVFRETTRAGDRLWARGEREDAARLYQEAVLWKKGDFFPKYLYEEEFEDKRDQLNAIEDHVRERLETYNHAPL